MGYIDDLKDELQKTYLSYFRERSQEMMDKCLSGRLVIDFRQGKIEKIYDQAIVSGGTMLDFYSEKIT